MPEDSTDRTTSPRGVEPPACRTYADFFGTATGGHKPYPYQEELARRGLPELLVVETGAGKTAAVLLAWLWLLQLCAAPLRRLAYVLPLRTLVEQVSEAARRFVVRLGLQDDVAVHTLMGGEGGAADAWRKSPGQPGIFVGTQDMLLSRALMRSYGSSRFNAPIDFGMFNSGVHWVFDEVQLMGAAVPTSRQLQGLRGLLGTAQPASSTWMSATVDPQRLWTIDNPDIATQAGLTDADRSGALRKRLEAPRRVRRLPLDAAHYEGSLAEALVREHRPGTRTIAVLNTVKRATDTYRSLRGLLEGDDVDVVLLHSRFRPPDRSRLMKRAVEADLGEGGRIVVTTQILEAGVDVTSATLFTEVARWSSIVQRAGRCNRDGEETDALLLWCPPPSPAPYEEPDVDASAAELSGLDGSSVTTTGLKSRIVKEHEPEYAVLRRRDLLDLFDTTPDLSGNEVDVSRFIRDAQDLDVEVAWRNIGDGRTLEGQLPPGHDELCRVPVADFRRHIKGAGARRAWLFNALANLWEAASPDDVRPGRTFLLDAAEGGYDSELGWTPRSRTPVQALVPPAPGPFTRADDSQDADYASMTGRWLTLVEHLSDTEWHFKQLVDQLGEIPGLSAQVLTAARVAARLHDIGKAHPCFQESIRATFDADGVDPGPGPWAKSGGQRRLRHSRRYFRHELVSALLLLDGAANALLVEVDAEHRPLTAYLVAAHHGKVRLGIRALPRETRPPDPSARFALGVWEGDRVPAVEVPGGRVPATTMRLDCMSLGSESGIDTSWTAMALGLRDDPTLGPFRLAFLEAVVRLADWQASAKGGRSS